MVRVESVVTHENHGGVLIREGQQRPQHGIVVAIGIVDHVLINRKVLLRDPWQTRRMPAHEGVPEVVDAAVINRREIPRLRRQQFRGGSVDGHGLGDDFGQRMQSFVFGLLHFFEIRHEQPQELAIQLHRTNAQLV
jgi:hypothetical protein